VFDIDELFDWYRAQLDEDERTATAALAGDVAWGGPVEPAQVQRDVAAKRHLLDAGTPGPGLRELALEFADRPGYRREWGPGDEWRYAHPK